MAKSEFRYNKKRKHYSYIFKQRDDKYKNILLSTKPIVKEKHNRKIKMKKNIKLFHHPDINNQNNTYLINKVYEDYIDKYCESYFQIDNYYRHVINEFSKIN